MGCRTLCTGRKIMEEAGLCVDSTVVHLGRGIKWMSPGSVQKPHWIPWAVSICWCAEARWPGPNLNPADGIATMTQSCLSWRRLGCRLSCLWPGLLGVVGKMKETTSSTPPTRLFSWYHPIHVLLNSSDRQQHGEIVLAITFGDKDRSMG